jgi:hypothetical protein
MIVHRRLKNVTVSQELENVDERKGDEKKGGGGSDLIEL